MMVAVVDVRYRHLGADPGRRRWRARPAPPSCATTTTASGQNVANANQNTDAWFVGYAPVGHPRIVAGALFPNQGAGGATAAPAVREVLVAGLQGSH